MAKYVASQGDTLKSLAKKYGLTRKRIRALNPDLKFGKGKKLGGKGFKDLSEQTIRLGKAVERDAIDPGNQYTREHARRDRKAELLQDPKYAAFLRNFDHDISTARGDFTSFSDRLDRDLERQDVLYDQQRTDGLRGVDRSMDNRGLFRSGQRGMERGRVINDIDLARQRHQDDVGERRLSAQRDRDTAVGDLRRARDEERLGARERLTMRDAETRFGF